MTLDELYREKGKLITTVEVSQAQLALINKEIADRINQANAADKKVSQAGNGKESMSPDKPGRLGKDSPLRAS